MQSIHHSLSKHVSHTPGALWAAKALMLGAGLMMLSSCSVDHLDARVPHASTSVATLAGPASGH